jgi:uncharacterized protein YkwD
MKSAKLIVLRIILVNLFFLPGSIQSQKKAPVTKAPKETAVAEVKLLSAEEEKLFNLVNEIRQDPKTFAASNKTFLQKEYPEFYARLNSAPKLDPLALECNYVNTARSALKQTKFTPCNLPGGHTMAPSLTDESKGDYTGYSDLQLICLVNFNLLEPDPNYGGICFARNKGIALSIGNYQGEEHNYHEEIKEYKAALAKKNIYLFQHMEPAIDRQLILLINEARKKKNLAPLVRKNNSRSNGVAGTYNSLYYNESFYGIKETDTAGILKSKEAKFLKENPDFSFKGFYRKLTVLEHMVDTVALARELFSQFLAAENKSPFLFDPKQTELGLNVNSSGNNFCLFATIAFYKHPETVPVEKAVPLGETEPEGTDMYKINLEVLRLVNELRASLSLKPVAHFHVTECAALFHSRYMARTGNFSHTEKNPGYESLSNRIDKFKGNNEWGTITENIAWFSSGYFKSHTLKQIALEVFTSWKDSPGHYRNMINPATDHAAVCGVMDPNGGGSYWTYVSMKKN